MLEELIQKIRQGDIQSFENFYILTFDTLFSYAWILTGAQRDRAQEMLVRTYCKVYGMREDLPEEAHVYEWLYELMDQTAFDWLEMSRETIDKIKREEENHETVVKLTDENAASVLLSIEELLGLMEEQEESYDRKKKIMSVVKFVFACGCFGFAVFAVCNGLEKLKSQLDILNSPLVTTLSSSQAAYDENGNLISDEQEGEHWIKVGDKLFYLSEIGQVLYSVPLQESDREDKTPYNGEIQESDNWVYYLPCPERADSKLANVSSVLVHTLYRMKKKDHVREVVAEEVQDYVLYKGAIYVMQYGRIQMLAEADSYEVLKDDLFAEVEEDGIYLYHVLGNQLQTSADGTLQIGDRLYKMKGNRIESVSKAECRDGDAIWYLKTEGGAAQSELYQMKAGTESVFDRQGIQINSFCKAGDYIYYSAYMRIGGSGAHYSHIYKKPLAGGETELVRDAFPGIIQEMYYNEENQTIYAEYLPRDWENGHGVLAAIGPDGVLNILHDPAGRDSDTTTGHDDLSFVFVQNQDVLCYWNNRSWIWGEKPFNIWSKPLVLPNNSRTPVSGVTR